MHVISALPQYVASNTFYQQTTNLRLGGVACGKNEISDTMRRLVWLDGSKLQRRDALLFMPP